MTSVVNARYTVIAKTLQLHNRGYVHGDPEARHFRYRSRFKDSDFAWIDLDRSRYVGVDHPAIEEEKLRIAGLLNVSMGIWTV